MGRRERREEGDPLLPRIIHQTWKDGSVPWQWLALQDTWRQHHPQWEYRLWSDAELRELVRAWYPWFLPAYDAFPEPIKRVDAARYFLMHRFGGVYADLDFESFRPLDDLVVHREVALVHEPRAHLQLAIVQQSGLSELLSNAFLASEAQHPFWHHVFARLRASARLPGPLDATGPFFLTRAAQSFPDRSRLTLLEPELLCPVTSQEAWDGALHDPLERARVAHEAYGAHHWSGSWFRRELGREVVDPGVESFPVSLLSRGRTLFSRALDLATMRPLRRSSLPRVSCLMVTTGRRLSMARRAIACFQEQTYAHRELVVVDDGVDDALQEYVVALDDPRIVYHRETLRGRPLGALRNLAVSYASGHLVCQWDDDDLYHPRRIALQTSALEATMADACFLPHNHVWWPAEARLARSVRRVWEGSILCLKAALPSYPELRIGEDGPVTEAIVAQRRVVLLDAPELYIYVAHGANTFAPHHFAQHWTHAAERYEGDAYGPKLDALLSPLSPSARE